MAIHAIRAPSKKSVLEIGRKKANTYYSVEFSWKGFEDVYLFRLRNTHSDYKWILVREDSKMLSLLKVGDVLALKFNFKNSSHFSEYLNTAIQFIIKQDDGLYKGHYFVGFEILEEEGQKRLQSF